jgi:hypothetical protein
VYSEYLERAWAFAEHIEFGAGGINVNDTTDLQALRRLEAQRP